MNDLKRYLLGIICAVLICGIFHALTKKSAFSMIIKLATGIFLLITVVAPFKGFDFHSIDIIPDVRLEADSVTHQAQSQAQSTFAGIIKDRTCAYILDKAEKLGLAIDVEVMLNDAAMPVPEQVTIKGNVSPYDKAKLMKIIADDLGVPEDAQLWI